MNRSAFTLVEVLAAVTLSAALVAAGGSWLLGLQRSTQTSRSRCNLSTAMATTAVRLRDDLMQATVDQPLGSRDSHGAWLITVAGAGGAARENIAWAVHEGQVIRRRRPLQGGKWMSETVATGIDRLEILPTAKGGPRLRVTAGGEELNFTLTPGAPDAP